MPHMFIPGPVDVEPEILAAQAQLMLPHRSAEFEAIFQRASDKARQLDRIFRHRAAGSRCSQSGPRAGAVLRERCVRFPLARRRSIQW